MLVFCTSEGPLSMPAVSPEHYQVWKPFLQGKKTNLAQAEAERKRETNLAVSGNFPMCVSGS